MVENAKDEKEAILQNLKKKFMISVLIIQLSNDISHFGNMLELEIIEILVIIH